MKHTVAKLLQKIENKANYQFALKLSMVVCATLILTDAAHAAASGGSMDFLTRLLKEVTDVLRKEGRIALEVMCASAGAWFGAKSGTWPPVLVGGTAAGMIEMLFKIIPSA